MRPVFAKLGPTVITSREIIVMSASRAVFGVALPACLVMALVVPASAQERSGPQVVRGVAASAPADRTARQGGALEIAAGERLWLIDRAGGELIGCRLIDTSTVGETIISCVDRRLPERLRN